MSLIPTPRIDIEHALASELGLMDVNVCLVGSQLICGSGNDVDLLVLTPADDAFLKSKGFMEDVEGLDGYPSHFRSWRRDDLNLIVTNSVTFYIAECTIAEAARALSFHARNDDKEAFDMRNREGRVTFHAIVRETVEMRLHAGLTVNEFWS